MGSPGFGGCGVIFRNCRAFVKGCFAIPLGQVFAFEAELLAASLAINFAWKNGWHRLWLESDSSYVVQLLSSRFEIVPWRVRQAWQRCIFQISRMNFQVQCLDVLDTDIVKVITEYVDAAIENLVLGAPSRHGFIRNATFSNSI
ncbi:hypothetical protein LWI28_014797 [Acer negundo]|uniref:RNase H type-1 domain-containing protein n=1 Tax=Acer negundo TaxID=4023 RepID=A0AAD5J6D7_ACENE|nr:hypothetical protein LWI28_014797 [Acer negundo]